MMKTMKKMKKNMILMSQKLKKVKKLKILSMKTRHLRKDKKSLLDSWKKDLLMAKIQTLVISVIFKP